MPISAERIMAQRFSHQPEHTVGLRRRNQLPSVISLRHAQRASCQHLQVGAGCSAGVQAVKGNSIRAVVCATS
jgi:hypothetical protein